MVRNDFSGISSSMNSENCYLINRQSFGRVTAEGGTITLDDGKE